MKLLCAADLHLGRQPSRLPDDLGGLAEHLTPAESWRRLVRLAIDEGVAAALLAGDVVEDAYDFFEAYSDLRRGAEELADAGIALLTVAGNHDVEVLPRLAEAVPTVKLLGEGGRWDRLTLEADGVAVNVVGWSWPAPQVSGSPLQGLADAIAGLPPVATLGLLHCDLDQPRSPYAAVSRADLAAAPIDAWLLGHVHKPSFACDASGRWCGYLGSAFGADPGEQGPRGAWLIEVGGEALDVEFVPLSPLLFDTVEVDVSAAAAPSDVSALIAEELSAHGERLSGLGEGGPLAVGVRLRLVGRHAHRNELQAHLGREDPREAPLSFGGARYFVHDVSFEVYPRIDLAAVAATDGPRALMARRLLLLDGPPGEERDRLIARARERLLETAGLSGYRDLDPPDLNDDAVAAVLRRAATRLLAEMMEGAP